MATINLLDAAEVAYQCWLESFGGIHDPEWQDASAIRRAMWFQIAEAAVKASGALRAN